MFARRYGIWKVLPSRMSEETAEAAEEDLVGRHATAPDLPAEHLRDDALAATR